MARAEIASLGGTVRSAAHGDEDAWRALFAHFNPVLKAVARGFRLAPADVDDVVQTTWARAFSRLHRLQEPEAFGGWLVVTARRESLRLLQRGTPEILTDEPPEADRREDEQPESAVLEAERREALRAAVRRLPTHQRRLLNALLATPWSSYDDLSSVLGMPVGSIGPTRNRSLDRLRGDAALVEVIAS
jgi:RNA polymerase sigma factor (sigma-70 family)